MGITETIKLDAYNIFGVDVKDDQINIIKHIYDRKHVLAVMPTGYGKSLCYQLPAHTLWKMANKLTLVVSPTIALQDDQVWKLKSRGIPAEAINSRISDSEKADIERRMLNRELAMVYITPERLWKWREELFLYRLKEEVGTLFMVIDEVHLVSEWGTAFRSAFSKIAQSANDIKAQLLMFSASISPTVERYLQDNLISGEPYIKIVLDPVRKNLVYHIENEFNIEWLYSRVKQGIIHTPLVIFSPTVQGVEMIYRHLSSMLVTKRCVYYHGKMTDAIDRESHSERFIQGDADIMVATSAWGLGVDKNDIRSVYHTGFPLSFEQYYQESGRGGRDGKVCECYLANNGNLDTQGFLIRSQYPELSQIESFIEKLKAGGGEMILLYGKDKNGGAADRIQHWLLYYDLARTEPYRNNTVKAQLKIPPESRQKKKLEIYNSIWLRGKRSDNSLLYEINVEDIASDLNTTTINVLTHMREMRINEMIEFEPPERGTRLIFKNDQVPWKEDYTIRLKNSRNGLKAIQEFVKSTNKYEYIRNYFGFEVKQ